MHTLPMGKNFDQFKIYKFHNFYSVYGVKKPVPTIPGFEGSGVVVES